ncbi:MAG TPA: hypothetical protein VFS20_05140 [Longimicrobium sp.]|nr:hypothetical protein [Longimicrobium sp.]
MIYRRQIGVVLANMLLISPAMPLGEQPMQRTILRVMVIALTVFLPGCLVITCGG